MVGTGAIGSSPRMWRQGSGPSSRSLPTVAEPSTLGQEKTRLTRRAFFGKIRPHAGWWHDDQASTHYERERTYAATEHSAWGPGAAGGERPCALFPRRSGGGETPHFHCGPARP